MLASARSSGESRTAVMICLELFFCFTVIHRFSFVVSSSDVDDIDVPNDRETLSVAKRIYISVFFFSGSLYPFKKNYLFVCLAYL